MGSSIEITPELLAGFLDEAPEYLDMLNVGLMDFESRAGSGVLSLETPEDQEQMNTMFRAAHSLKGLGAALGFDYIKELTHRMETLFDHVRMGKRDLTVDSFETLFQVFDRLKALVDELSDESAAPVEIDDLLAALDQILEDSPSKAAGAPNKSSKANPPAPQSNSVSPTETEATTDRNEYADDPELISLFLETTTETLEELNQGLLSLEENPTDPELLNKIFRCAHNIKGASGAVGLRKMNRVTHNMETVLDHLRAGRLQIEGDLMDAMLQTVDGLRAALEPLRRGEMTEVVDDALFSRFDPWIAGTAPSADRAPGGDIQDESPTLGGPDDGRLTITVTFPDGCEEAPIQAYLIHNKLEDLGTMISSDPDMDAVTGDATVKKIVFVLESEEEASAIQQIIGMFAVESVVVSGAASDSSDVSIAACDTATSPAAITSDGGSAQVTPRQATPQADAPVTQSGRQEQPAKATTSKPAAAPGKKAATKAPAAKGPGKRDAPAVKTGETLRVDQERLDQLMNLGGELVITRARFTQIHSRFREVFEGKNLGYLVDDMTERVSRLGQHIEELGSGQRRTKSVDELRTHLLHLTQSFRTVRSLVEQVHDARTSMYDFDEALHELNRVSDGIQKGIMGTRMVPIGPLFSRFRRVIRDIAKSSGKQVNLVLHGDTTELDKRMVDELGDPLTHMVRNSVDHGIETPDIRTAAGKDPTGTVILEARHRGNSIWIEVKDDGAGINLERVKAKIIEKELASPTQVEAMSDRELMQFVLQPGFSTAKVVTDLSGRGMGMDIVVNKIEKLSGIIELDSTPGQGTHVTIKLPLTLAILTSMVARIGKGIYAIPLEAVAEIITVRRSEIQWIQKRQVVRVRDRVVPLAFFEDIFETTQPDLQTAGRNQEELTLLIVGLEAEKIGLVVDGLLGQEDVVIKSIADNYRNVRGIAGASIRGDGTISLILDVTALLELAEKAASRTLRGASSNPTPETEMKADLVASACESSAG